MPPGKGGIKMNINRIGVPDYTAPWEKRKAQRSIAGTDFSSRMAELNGSDTVIRASDRVNGSKAISDAAFRRDAYVSDTSGIQTTCLYSKESISAPQESDPSAETDSEIIVKPDGSRVLMITVDVGGTQAVMSLQISEPTNLQNDISKQKNDGSTALTDEVVLMSEEVSDLTYEE